MKISSDYKDLLRNLNAAGVRYLIVGGYAVMIYTEPGFTKDLDLWVDPSEGNALALFQALAQFGAPLQGIRPADFTEPELFYQVGIDPVRDSRNPRCAWRSAMRYCSISIASANCRR
jgi:hypothetical protein